MTTPRRVTRRRVLRAIGVVVAGWAAFVAVLLALAGLELRAGREAARRARARPAVDVLNGRANGDLRRARDNFAAAARHLRSPALLPTYVIPLAGRQVRAAHNLAAVGRDVVGVALDGVGHAQALLAGRHPAGPARVTLLERSSDLAFHLDRRLGAVTVGSGSLLLPPLASARAELVGQVTQLRRGLQRGGSAAGAAANLLSGPRRYLIFAANNAEMRAGSGMFLSVGELETQGGQLGVSNMQSVTDVPVPAGAVPLTGDLADRWGWLHPNIEWRNLMVSPRFDTSAALAAQMWRAAGHGDVDGVLAVDPIALEAILRAVGPVAVSGHTVDANNVVTELLHDQYTRLPALEQRPERREELGQLASAALAAVDSRSWSAANLAEDLASAARGRHILAWSARADEEQAWVSAGIGGLLAPNSLLVSLVNRGGNKLDQFLTTDARLSFRRSANHTEVVVTLRLQNHTPAGEVPYIAGPDPNAGLTAGEYLGIATFSLPAQAAYGRLDGVSDPVVAGPDGQTRVIGTFVRVLPGGRATVVARFGLAGRHGTLRVESSARVPPLKWRDGAQRWSDTQSRLVNW